MPSACEKHKRQSNFEIRLGEHIVLEVLVIAAIRWGQSDYETDTDLAKEVAALEELGVLLECTKEHAPDLSEAEVLVVTSGVQVSTLSRCP